MADPTNLSDATNKKYVDDKLIDKTTSAEVCSIVSGYPWFTNTYIDGGICDLSIQRLSSYDDYASILLSSSPESISNTMYVVSTKDFDVFGEKIKNVGYPQDLSDAATKEYVDKAKEDLSDDYSG